MSDKETTDSGLEVILTTLQTSSDKETIQSIISILNELLSMGTERRIHYVISKGGSEALLQALVNSSHKYLLSGNSLQTLLHLLVKVGQKDKMIGRKAKKTQATITILNLVRKNMANPRTLTPCLWIVQMFAGSVTAGGILGRNGATELIYKLLVPFTAEHTRVIRAAAEAFAALMKSVSNSKRAVTRGYVQGLLRLYQNWHSYDIQHKYVHIRRAFLRCLDNIANTKSGRQIFWENAGMEILFHITQSCASNQSLKSILNASVQIMRKCYPRSALPTDVIQSAYNFPVPGGAHPTRTCSLPPDNLDDDSEEDVDSELENVDVEDDDLETDVEKLKTKPDPDRPRELLQSYKKFCPELFDDFQDSDSESFDRNCTKAECSSKPTGCCEVILNSHIRKGYYKEGDQRALGSKTPESFQQCHLSCPVDAIDNYTKRNGLSCSTKESGFRPRNGPNQTMDSLMSATFESNSTCTSVYQSGKQLDTCSFHSRTDCIDSTYHSQSSFSDKRETHDTVLRLLERHNEDIPFHDPSTYIATARKTASVQDYNVLAFPDFWGIIPAPYQQPMTEQKYGTLRDKIFQDVQRLLKKDDILNRLVFDLQESSLLESVEEIDTLKFFSKFESGNLRRAIQVRRYEYDLILNSDVNNIHHHQWFYFEISGMKAGVPYRFNIINCEKANSQFNYGMQPVLYSVCEALQGRPYWQRVGDNICYYRNSYVYTVETPEGSCEKPYFTLTFNIQFPHTDDVCYLAYHFPYTYSTLMTHLHLLGKSVKQKKVYFRNQSLCNTLGGNPCPLVTITALPKLKSQQNVHQFRNRPYLVLTARVHPGESNASWIMKGTLEFLLSDDPAAELLREMYIIKVIPMLNPDGVINGNHRSSLTGEDLNRQWSQPSPTLHPTVYHLKGLLHYLNSIRRTPLVFCDYHGHSRKKNVFMYGCSIKETLWQSGSSINTASLKEDIGYRTLPKVLSKVAPAFVLSSCSFQVEKSRESTARVVVWREIGVLRSYTMESSYCGSDQGKYKGLQFGIKELQEMGAKLCIGLLLLNKNSLPYNKAVFPQMMKLLTLEDDILDHRSFSNEYIEEEPPCPEEIDFNSCFIYEEEFADIEEELEESSSDSEDTETTSELQASSD
ncbi:cytosolic carboxypeptidase 4 [Protopterus annectens]|uniref:cytosolic carboxypeptidase 4 n=1 Tax=Protopterus annectens TaxID=7888 RepID=UPI001CFA9DA7|nr:cytosolic carboxypeptidase 4 [Protopterus annectens]